MRTKFAWMTIAVMAAICLTSPAALYAGQAKSEQGTNQALRKEFSYKDFSRIKVSPSYSSISGRGTFIFGRFRITVIKSDTYKVVMDVRNREDIDLFDIRKSGDEIELLYGYRKYPYHSSPKNDIDAEVTICTPELSEITMSGQSTMTVIGGSFSGKSLNMRLAGASNLKGLSGKWDNAFLGISGCSEIENISVESRSLNLNASGATKVSGSSAFRATDYARIDLLGAASVKLISFNGGNAETSISGAANFVSERTDAASFKLSMLGGSSFRTSGNINEVSAVLSGAANAMFSGTGKNLVLSELGSASLKAKDFTVSSAKVSASGAASTTITVTEKLETDIRGAATLDYYGHPKEVRTIADNVRGH